MTPELIIGISIAVVLAIIFIIWAVKRSKKDTSVGGYQPTTVVEYKTKPTTPTDPDPEPESEEDDNPGKGKSEEAQEDKDEDEEGIEEDEDTEEVDLSSLKVPELKALAKERGLTGYSKLRKAELVEALS